MRSPGGQEVYPSGFRPSSSRATRRKAGMGKTIALFDVDGTLTVPRQKATQKLLEFMQKLKGYVTVGIVGGSDLVKIQEQLGANAANEYDYLFSENGLVAHKAGELLATQSLKKFLGEDNLKRLINFVLKYVSELDIPVKRGTFIEFRNGMLNVSPIGRNCSQEERDEFERFDSEAGVRKKFVEVLEKEFEDLKLKYSIGGQISFDVFPLGWDKTYCLRFLEEYDEVHFFGDKTYEGGNDYEIYTSDRTVGHSVESPDDTMEQCTELFMLEEGAKPAPPPAGSQAPKVEKVEKVEKPKAKEPEEKPKEKKGKVDEKMKTKSKSKEEKGGDKPNWKKT